MKTLKFKNILAPFEFNSCFKNSFKMAQELSERSGAKITLLNVINSAEAVLGDYVANCTMPLNGFISIIDERQNAIERFLIEEGYPFKNIEIKVEMGNYNSVIIDMHRIKEFDLIVIPDFSKNPLERLFADINPLEIMNRTNTAVIAVNRNSRKFGIKRIVLPIRNVKNWYDKIPFTSAIAKLTGAKIYIIGVANSTTKLVTDRIEQKIEFCKSHFQKFGIIYEAETIFGHGEIFKDIILLSNYKRADLIAVSPPVNHNMLNSYFNSSLYNKLISKSNIPVMGVTLT